MNHTVPRANLEALAARVSAIHDDDDDDLLGAPSGGVVTNEHLTTNRSVATHDRAATFGGLDNRPCCVSRPQPG